MRNSGVEETSHLRADIKT